ncbi:MAG: hypothetical protein JWO46_582 [Nocardioidaceae bacterium]|nr:hypothetical protein [Nocardioidaceae bacterium]
MNVDSPQEAGRRAESSDLLDSAVRAGLVAYGVVHLVIAWLALQLAFGRGGGEKASSTGALHELAGQPLGRVLVWAVAVGMLLLVVWRGLEASVGHRDEDGADRVRKRVASGGKGVIYAVLAVSALRTALGSGSGGKGSDGMTATVLGWPGGQVYVVVGGLAVVAYGGWTAYRGWAEKFLEHLDAEGKSGDSGRAYRLFGKAGYLAKGLSIALVGALFVYAGATHDAQKSGGLDDALHEVLQQPFGQLLLVVIGLGIGCYGLFCFARARHLSR